MTSTRVVLPVLLAVVLMGCAGSYQVVQIPPRDADLYPVSQTRAGVTIAIDEVRDAARAERYFGADLLKEGILPVSVIVSNYSEHRVVVKPSDILLHRDRGVVDPLPLEMVVATAKSEHGSLHAKAGQPIEKFFESIAFRETVLLPRETYRGVMFFAVSKPEKQADTVFTLLRAFREGAPKLRVAVTNLDSSERVHFGPFSLTPPDTASLFSNTSH